MSHAAASKVKQGGSALYGQVASIMRRRITTGAWGEGERIPSLEELVRTFDVARVTVRQAVELLEAEGLLETRRGLGTFVPATLPERQWLRLGARWTDVLATVKELSPSMVALEDCERLPRLDPSEGKLAESYQFMRRVHTKNGEPYCILNMYIDKRVYDRAPEEFRSNIVLPLIETAGRVKIGRARQTLTIGSADAETAPHLGLPLNAPTAEVRRVICDEKDVVIYFAELVYRGDAIRLEIDLLS